MDFNAGKNVYCPCKGCEERHCACSDTCHKYKEYKVELEKQKRYTEENKCRFSSTHQRPYMHIGKSARERKSRQRICRKIWMRCYIMNQGFLMVFMKEWNP